jgi:hypothetical protein
VAVIPAILTSSLVNLFGTVFHVSAPAPELQDPARRWRFAAVGILAYVFLLRLVYIGQVDLVPQEAYYWNYAQHPALSYLDHPPMVAWLIGLGTKVLGTADSCRTSWPTFAALLPVTLLACSASWRIGGPAGSGPEPPDRPSGRVRSLRPGVHPFRLVASCLSLRACDQAQLRDWSGVAGGPPGGKPTMLGRQTSLRR